MNEEKYDEELLKIVNQIVDNCQQILAIMMKNNEMIVVCLKKNQELLEKLVELKLKKWNK